jgi:hypothetical protein
VAHARSQHRPRTSSKQRNALTCFAMHDKFATLFPARLRRSLGWWNW